MAWDGLRRAIRGLDAEDVAWRPAAGRHNIWELTAHAAYWKYVVRRRLTRKREAFPLQGSNFIAAPARIDDASWREVVRVLEEEHRKLREVIVALSDADLGEPKKQRMIYGIAAHDLYHTGQIQLVKRLRG